MVQRVEGYGVERLGPGRSGEADAGRIESHVLLCCGRNFVDCVDTRTDGRRILKIKDTLTLRTRESEHHIAQLCSSSVIGEKLKISSAALCLTEPNSEYVVALVYAEALQGSFLTIGPGTCARAVVEGCSERKTQTGSSMQCVKWRGSCHTRHATWSMLRFQVKSESRTTLVRVLESHRIQDKIESATEVASELRRTAWIATRHREECEGEQIPCRSLTTPRLTETRWGM